MSIISKETWNKFTQEEKEKIRKEWETKNTAEDNAYIPWYLENLFGKENLQPIQLTYEDVVMNLFLDKQFYRFNGDGGVFCDDYRVYSNDDYWNPLNCLSQKQAEKLLAINRLLNVAKFLNKDWKPDWENVQEPKWYLEDLENEIGIDCIINCNSRLVYFRTKELAQQAFQILGEDTVRLALTTEY